MKMAEQMLFTELLTGHCGEECKGMVTEKLKKRKWILIPGFIMIALIISLCAVVSVLHEKQNNHNVDCVLRPTFKKYDHHKVCPHVDRYPLSNDIFVRICVNDTQQIDIRRFHNDGPDEEGITLSLMQWQYLKKSVDHIDESILQSQKNM
jgi:hypothetical protein